MSKLIALEQLEVDAAEVLAIKRNELLPIVQDAARLNHYAGHIVQAQVVLLNGVNPSLTQALSETIGQIIAHLRGSKKNLKPKKFNALQRWFGQDIEYKAAQLHELTNLDRLVEHANLLSQQIQVEIQKSQARFQQATGLREQMATYIIAAQQFLREYPDFQQLHVFDALPERLSKRIQTLHTVQASHDIALAQLQLTQQLALGLLDRFHEAQQVLIPAWQYHLQQRQAQHAQFDLVALNQNREQLIQVLQQSLQKK